tara:strand:+ start:236875 stop:237027 length:153 start_codon:yes stop_codon:yes gene_type:complete
LGRSVTTLRLFFMINLKIFRILIRYAFIFMGLGINELKTDNALKMIVEVG